MKKKYVVYPLVPFVLVAILVSVAVEWGEPVGLDPTLRHYLARGEFWETFSDAIYWEISPPLFLIIDNVASRTFVDQVLFFRVLNIILLSLSCLVSYRIMRNFSGAIISSIFSIASALNITVLTMVQRSDNYILFGTLGVFTICGAVESLSNENEAARKRGLIIYAASVVLAAMTHYHSAVLILAVALAGGYVRRSDKTALKRWVYSHIPLVVAGIAWLPMFYYQLQIHASRFGSGFPPGLPFGSVAEAITPMRLEPISMTGISLSLVIAILFFMGMRCLFKDRIGKVVAISIVCCISIVGLMDSVVASQKRYALQAALLVPIGLAAGLSRIRKETLSNNHKNVTYIVATLAVLPYVFSVQTIMSKDISSEKGRAFLEYSSFVDKKVENGAEKQSIVSNIPAGKGVLKFYSSLDYSVKGIPVDIIKGNRIISSVHENMSLEMSKKNIKKTWIKP